MLWLLHSLEGRRILEPNAIETCPMCWGDGELLGRLADQAYYSCRQCGLTFGANDVAREEAPTDG